MNNVKLVPPELITSNRDAIRKAREAFQADLRGQDPGTF